MVCKKCGAALSKGSLFCSNCGTKAESAPAAPPTGNSWFTPAGGLDDQLSGAPAKKVDTPVEPPKPPVREEPARPIVTPAREEPVKPVTPPVTPRYVPMAFYENGENVIKIWIVDYLDDDPSQVEQSSSAYEIYEQSGIKYYIFRDNDQMRAAWINESFECCITGPLSVEEIKNMINSIEKG